jgi:putative FmdB family regulatory protein
MPIYEYQCQVCSVRFERKQSVYDDPVTTCPECGGKVRKLFFPAGIIFKGSGWYKTDNPSSGYSAGKKEEASPSASTSSPAKSEAAKSDAPKADTTKSEPKSESKKSDAKSEK